MLNFMNKVVSKMIDLSPISVFLKNDNPHKFDPIKKPTT